MSSLSATQTAPGEYEATYRLTATGAGVFSYVIYAEDSSGGWHSKDSGYVTAGTTATGTISFDELRRYHLKAELTATATGTVTTVYAYVTLSPYVPPAQFSWTYPKTQGGAFNLTAAEWNGLWDFIEDKKGRSVSHTAAAPGIVFTAAMYNEAVSAIGAGTQVGSGDTITAALMNALVTNVNAM